MSLAKMVTLSIVGVLGYQYQDAAAHHLRVIYDLYPVARTYMEMVSYRSGLSTWVKAEGSLPGDVRSWLNGNYRTTGKDDAGIDYFGTPYQGDYDAYGRAQLRSCGRDHRCYNSDDLIVPLES